MSFDTSTLARTLMNSSPTTYAHAVVLYGNVLDARYPVVLDRRVARIPALSAAAATAAAAFAAILTVLLVRKIADPNRIWLTRLR